VFKIHVVLAGGTMYILFAERLFARFSTGGRGILSVMELWMLATAAALLISSERKATAFCRNRRFWVYFFPYILLASTLPFLGALFNDYPFRTVLESLQGIQTVSLLILGSWMACAGPSAWETGRKYIFFAIMVQFTLASAQFAHAHGWVTGGVFDLLAQWDVRMQQAYSERYVLTARSVGSYLNPNTLGYWAALAFWSALIALKGAPRLIGAAASVGVLIASQSRGSTLAMLASLTVWFIYVMWSGDRQLRRVRDMTLAVAVCLLVGCSLTGLLMQDRLAITDPTNRYERGFQYLLEGGGVDRNAQGRVLSWNLALDFFAQHPFGTLGEPRTMFPHIVDNDYVRTLLQGSLPYLFAFLLMLLGTFRLLATEGRMGWLLGLFSVVTAVNAVTAYPLSYPVISIYFIGAGFFLSRTAEPYLAAANAGRMGQAVLSDSRWRG
jgi:hypothetical protein